MVGYFNGDNLIYCNFLIYNRINFNGVQIKFYHKQKNGLNSRESGPFYVLRGLLQPVQQPRKRMGKYTLHHILPPCVVVTF